MVLPVVERELRVASRRRGTYTTRIFAAGVVIGAFVWNGFYFLSHEGSTAEQSRSLFLAFTVAAFVFCALIGVLTTADCISEEKREGTLGLLFLTDLKGHDIIYGKVVAGSVTVVYGLIATLPIASLALIMGGVSIGQFIAVALLLLTTMAESLAIGIYVSTQQTDERRVMVMTVFLVLAFMVFPLGVCGGPLYALFECVSSLNGATSIGWTVFGSIVWTWILISVFVASASLRLPDAGEPEPPALPQPHHESLVEKRLKLGRPARSILDKNPFQWLALRSETRPGAVWIFVVSMLLTWFVSALQMGDGRFDPETAFWVIRFTHGFLKLWIAIEATRRFVEDQRVNSLEFLLSTPLNESRIIVGEWRALWAQFGGPIILVMVLECVGLVKIYHSQESQYFLPYINSIVLLPLDALALGSLGMWFALRMRRRGRAIFSALFLVLFLRIGLLQAIQVVGPGSMLVANSSLGGIRAIVELVSGVLIDLGAITFAMLHTVRNFRRYATERYGGSPA